MSEVTFAKGFLATLDKRPIKLPADHVSDPRKYPNQSPYILPRQTHPFPRKERPSGASLSKVPTITVTLKPMRSGDIVTLTDVELNATIHDIKTQYADKTGQSLDKIKLLLNKKPAADLKTLKDLGISGDVELSAMVMGGGSTPAGTTPAVEKPDPVPASAAPASGDDPMDIDSQAPAPESEKAMAEAATSSATVDTVASTLKSEEFWTDLKGFLVQRLRDEPEAEKLAATFRNAWQSQAR